MVKNKKALILLLVFLAFSISPVYPKDKSIKYLPPNENIEMSSKSYGTSELTLAAANSSDESCVNFENNDCMTKLKKGINCNECVDLRDSCPDCCADGYGKDVTNPEPKINCTPEKDSKYQCQQVFELETGKVKCGAVCGDSDSKVDCDEEDEELDGPCEKYACTIKTDYIVGHACSGEETGGEVASGSPYGLHRRGCPDELSDYLKPNGTCTDVSGSGLDRVWKCDSVGLSPKFRGEMPVSDSGLQSTYNSFSTYGQYYAVTKVTPKCTYSSDSCSESCSSSCSGYPGCSGGNCWPPSCTPSCPSAGCDYSCVSGTACTSADTSTGDCSCSGSSCSPGLCSSSCTAKKITNTTGSCIAGSCSNSCSSSCTPSSAYYVYKLSSSYRSYIESCIAMADAYEECEDGISCCQEGLCSTKVVKKECNAGYDMNCNNDDDCQKRACYTSSGICLNSNNKYYRSGDCSAYISAGQKCLAEKTDCFKEIDESVKREFVAKAGESVSIIWQMNTDVAAEAQKEGLNLYTLVKVMEVEPSFGAETVVHTSPLLVKSLNASFSIYGTAMVPLYESDGTTLTLKGGKTYRVRAYYFFPVAQLCDDTTEAACQVRYYSDYTTESCDPNAITIQVNYLSLIVSKSR